MLYGCTRNQDVYLKIADALKVYGHNCTWQQVSCKLKNSRKAYRQDQMMIKKSGASPEDIMFK